MSDLSLFEQGLVLLMLVMTPVGLACTYRRFRDGA